RFTTRRLMAMVAAAAFALGSFAMGKRLADMAEVHRTKSLDLIMKAERAELRALGSQMSTDSHDRDVVAPRYRRTATYFYSLAGNYERAASSPWLPVPPDLPPPE